MTMDVNDIVCNNDEPIPKDASIGMVENIVLNDKSDSTVEIPMRVYFNDCKTWYTYLKIKNDGNVGECPCKVDLLSEYQLLERDEAVKLGRKHASKHFFHRVLYRKIFKHGNHLYHLMEHDIVFYAK